MSDQVCLARASKEFELSSNVLENAIEIGVISAQTKGKCCRILLSKKEIEEKLPLLRTGSRFLRLINRNHNNIDTTEKVKPKPKTEPIQKTKPESEPETTTTQTTPPTTTNIPEDSDRISMKAAVKEFDLSYSFVKRAIKQGAMSVKANKGHKHIILSRKEIQEKLPEVKKRSKATPHYHRPNNSNIKPEPIEIKKEFLKVEGAQVWTSSPCVGCSISCDPVTCSALDKWIR